MLNFTFTIDETNIILSALSTQPYNNVAALITNIQQQAQGQLDETDLEDTTPAPAES